MKRVSVGSNKGTDEGRRDALEVDAPLTYSDVLAQVLLVNTSERTQEVTHRSPQPFNRVSMHLPDAISIIVSGPLLAGVLHSRVEPASCSFHSIVPSPLVGTHLSGRASVDADVPAEGCRVSRMHHSQSHFSTRPADSTHGTHDGRPIISVGAVTPLLVSSSSGWIEWVEVLLTFFPRRSETSRPFQSLRQGVVSWASRLRHCVATAYVSDVPCSWQDPTLRLGWLNSHPSIHLSQVTPPVKGLDVVPRTRCLCTSCRCSGNDGTCTPGLESGAFFGRANSAQLKPGTSDLDNVAPVHESAPLSKRNLVLASSLSNSSIGNSKLIPPLYQTNSLFSNLSQT